VKKKTKLCDLEAGKLFMTPDMECLAVKSEYTTEQGAIEAIIVGSGEMFWGGTSDPKVQRVLDVLEVEVIWDNIPEDTRSRDKCIFYDCYQGRHKCTHRDAMSNRCYGVCVRYAEK